MREIQVIYYVDANGEKRRVEQPKLKEDLQILQSIRKITSRGNHAEVKRKKDGHLTVYEVKKNIVAVE